MVLWLTLVGMLSLGFWAFYKRRLAPEARLIRAAEAGLRRGEFRLEYQPVMSLSDGKCVGVEAMIRWSNAEHGLKGPAYYMRILEKTRLIARLTRFVLSTAARELADLTADSSLYIGVNVYSDHVESRGFASDVTRSAKAILSRLVLNMSQHRCAPPTIDVQGTVAALRAKRVRFALTNIDYVPPDPLRLETFRFEQVKLDRHIMTLDEDERRQRLNALVRAVRSSGATVVAEGVENIKQHEAATQSGVDLGQGFFYARTMSLSLLVTFLEAGGESLRMRKKKRWKLR
jgi:EAL domain-containing protein (putative c-di-GMP-specific phosphodiesterase class I)